MVSAKQIEKIRDDFLNTLRRENLRATTQRFEILEAILKMDGHFSADDLFFKMKMQNKKVSRATVYNTLELLFKMGIVSRHRVGSGLVYENSIGKEHHDHLICLGCGAIIEFSSPEIEKIQDEICRKFKFKPIRHTHQIFGLCSKCTGKEK